MRLLLVSIAAVRLTGILCFIVCLTAILPVAIRLTCALRISIVGLVRILRATVFIISILIFV